MSVTTRYQVSQGKRPQIVFNQLPPVQTRQKRKEKEPIFDQSPRSQSKTYFDPKSHFSDLSTPLAPSHSGMDMSYTVTRREREAMDQNLDDIYEQHRNNMIFGNSSHDDQPGSPLINTRYLDAHQRDERYKRRAHQE